MLPKCRIVTPECPCPANAEWRVLSFNDHYEVSEYGHLRRHIGGSNSKRGKVIKPCRASGRYWKYTLCRDGTAITASAHRLVAVMFLGQPPRGAVVVAHNDGDMDNCHCSNLRWTTQHANNLDKILHGSISRGEAVNTAKLTEDDVRAIRASNELQQVLADRYGVRQATISSIKLFKSWRHVL